MPSMLGAIGDVRSGRFFEFFQIAMEHFVDQARFARARYAGDADEHAERNLDVDVFEIVGAGAADLDRALRNSGLRLLRRKRNRLALAQISRGERSFVFQQLFVGAGKHHLAALLAGLRSEIDDVIAFFDDLGIVLDDDDGILIGAQAVEDLDQAAAVARMQADRRLVEHVERVDQRRADGGGEIDALQLAAGKRARLAVEREIFQTDADQIAEPAANLVEDQTRHLIERAGRS